MAELGQRTTLAVKYSYLVGFFALMSGVFYPIVTNSSFTDTISGIIILSTGLFGGILIYYSAISKKSATLLLIAGLVFIVISVVLVVRLGHGL